MIQKKTYLFWIFLCVVITSHAQREVTSGDIDVVQDSRINELVLLEKSIDEIPGYRLQICFDSDKNVIDEARDRFLKLYPTIDTYVEFEAPHFNLKVGDFRTRLEAEKIKRQIFLSIAVF